MKRMNRDQLCKGGAAMQKNKYWIPAAFFAVFEIVAVVLWQTKENPFYLFNFSYIGFSISLGLFLFLKKYKHALSGKHADRGILVLSVHRCI